MKMVILLDKEQIRQAEYYQYDECVQVVVYRQIDQA